MAVNEKGTFRTISLWIEKQDPTTVGILIAVAVVFITVLVTIFTRKRNNRRAVLLVGPCDAGKTLMFNKLVRKNDKRELITVTSLAPNTGEYHVPAKNKALRILDLPGHDKLRLQMLEQNKHLARGLVFVLDSGTVQKEIKEVAEYLYTILSDSVVLGNVPPVLIACNKQDQHLVKSSSFIEKQLLKEINTVRVTRSAALQQTDSSDNNNTFLGRRDKDFEFSDLKPMRVQIIECSAMETGNDAKPGLRAVEDWLTNIA